MISLTIIQLLILVIIIIIITLVVSMFLYLSEDQWGESIIFLGLIWLITPFILLYSIVSNMFKKLK